MSCSVGCTHGSDPKLLWLWHRPAATAPIGPLDWEPPYAEGAAVKRKKKKKTKIRKRNSMKSVPLKAILKNQYYIYNIYIYETKS